MSEYDEIVKASDKNILLLLDAELEEISHKIESKRHRYENSNHPREREGYAEELNLWIAHYTGFFEARKIAYNSMKKNIEEVFFMVWIKDLIVGLLYVVLVCILGGIIMFWLLLSDLIAFAIFCIITFAVYCIIKMKEED